jgi:acyl dehydratase
MQEEEVAARHEGVIEDSELDRLRGKLGHRVTVSDPPYLTEVTRDAIRHWTVATGDRSPQFSEEGRASRSGHGTLIAPPCMLYAFSKLSIGYRGGLPGVHSMFAGSHWRWHDQARLGDRIDASTVFTGLDELSSRFARRMFKQSSRTQFSRADGTRIADVIGWGMRVERETARATGKYSGVERSPHTPEDIAAVSALYAEEAKRASSGSQLFWEDVRVGDQVPVIVRGPYSATTAVAFEQAWGGLFITAHGYWFDRLREHPRLGITNEYGVPEPPEAVHWDSALAKSVGVPDAYDYGPERISWLATLLTSWGGLESFLQELYVEVRRFNLIGDITYLEGEVTETTPGADGAAHGTVRVDIRARNQRDEITAKGWGSLRLPTRPLTEEPRLDILPAS